ncbi:hypothetical protein AHX68_21375 [Salmonella enterica subsp. enterica serovar Muenchen]|nr:hypothetical protein [Salmonella enterica subsp. enterica serovar Muenchen]ECZ5457786.1 hypothetical protein [Salmonella enterica subsp. enterica serovar Muenchen]EDG8467514.1 hypothetical protein [Salmonella enterica subsp. enterica serovar Muenchen]EDQ9741565.1 hypothetical protein [Salmonella enterica subsp. enterica serovar Oranienburg]EEN7398941.1 hypothetical protein [Salmonella enterica subsp. enterica serovar Muenchen]
MDLFCVLFLHTQLRVRFVEKLTIMFNTVQKKRTSLTKDDIRCMFTEIGIKGEDYDSAWSSFAVTSLVARQTQAMNNFRVKGVPSIYVKGQYQINPRGIEAENMERFISYYAETVRQLTVK